MKTWAANFRICLFASLFFAFNAPASVLYVDVNSSNPTPPYASWSTAATDIQSAIDVSSDGDQIWVNDGIYQTGGRVVYGSLTNRVVVNKAVTVQSVNGPAVTMIQGYQLPGSLNNGDGAVRCVYMTNNATLIGFTVTGGATRRLSSPNDPEEQSGGGVWCESASGSISNCIVTGNSCALYGAGAYSGTLNNSQIFYNTNQNGSGGGGGGAAFSTVLNSIINSNNCSTAGGAFSCSLSNCVIAGNSMAGVLSCVLNYCTVENNTNLFNGGGAVQSTLNNCMLYNNRAGTTGLAGYGGGAYECELNFCTVSNNWASGSGGGIYDLVNATNRSGQNNLVVANSASLYGGGVYFIGSGQFITNWNFNGWTFTSNSAVRDGGALYLVQPTSLINCTFSGNSSGANGGGFSGQGSGFTVASNCTFINNIAVGYGGGAYGGSLNNCLIVGNQAGSGGGVYGTMSNSIAENNVAITNGGGIYYYSLSSPGPAVNNCNFTNNAAGNGGGAYGGSYSNCVFLGNSASTNGGGFYGITSPISTFLNCMVMSNQAVFGGGGYNGILVGCRVIGNSATNSGGGIYNSSPGSPNDSNCLFSNNHATINAGAVYGGTLSKCTLSSNSAANGGGAYGASLTSCIVSNNLAGIDGGGTYSTTIVNCLLTGNSAAYGGGAFGGSTLNNSTLVSNMATSAGGGTYFQSGGVVTSCIVYDNSAPSGTNYSGAGNSGTYNYCCTFPLPSGNFSITNDPAFVNLAAGNFRLQTNSPCINAGSGSAGSTDLDGRPRMVGGRIDIGAYEFQAAGIGEFIAWLQQYGLPTDGSADYLDSDGDGMNNWQEFIAGTNPTNAASVLRMSSPSNTVSGMTLTWQSVTNVTYYLQRSTNLAEQPAFSSIQSNIVGQAVLTSYTDTNAVGSGSFFYRVGVQ